MVSAEVGQTWGDVRTTCPHANLSMPVVTVLGVPVRFITTRP